MTAVKNPIVETRILFADAQRQFDSSCQKAGRILEAFMTEIAQDVQRSAGTVARLESDLEMFGGLENTRMSASTRREIATAMDHHRGVVDGAKARLRHCWQDYNGRIIAAAAALAAAPIAAAIHVPV